MFTELSLYKVLFVIEMLVAMHIFSLNLKKKKNISIRYIVSIALCLLGGIIFPVFENFSYTWWYSSLMFLALFLLCMISLFFVYDSSWQKIFFISITSYTIQHLSHEIYTIIALALNITESSGMGIYGNEIIDFTSNAFPFVLCLGAFVVVYSIAYLVLNKRINNYEEYKVKNSLILLISGLILFTDVIFNSLVLYLPDGFNKMYSYTVCLYNLLCCFMILFIQFSVLNTKKIQIELNNTNHLLHQAEQRYKENKENVNLINMKCHDLRHQIRIYGGKEQMSKQTIEDLEKMINIYDSTVKTGNETIDLILTEKSLYCQKNHIKLTCLADCSKLDFIVDTDLYSLFGNAVDNAIEAVVKVNQAEKRNINLIVRNVSNYVSITIENYFDGNINIGEDGLPITTKNDINYHGYGIKSIQYIVNKYKGNLSISVKKDIFSLFILFVID